MSDPTPALYEIDGHRLVPSDFTRGPWDPGLQHGGPVCGVLGLLMADAVTAADRATDHEPLVLTRLTVELLRPVPVAPLDGDASVDRIGRRTAVASARLVHDQPG